MHSERDNASFSEHREHILKTAKALVEDTKTLVAGAAGSQDQLAAAAQNAVSTIGKDQGTHTHTFTFMNHQQSSFIKSFRRRKIFFRNFLI